MAGDASSTGRKLRPPRRLKFTRSGKYFVGMTLLVGFGAVNTGNNLLYLLLGMMLALILLSGVLSELVLQRLQLRRSLPERVFAGRPSRLELLLANGKPRAPSFSVQVRERVAGLAPERCPTGYLLRVEPQGEAAIACPLLLPRRGSWQLEGWELATLFPFGLFRKSRELDASGELVALPPMLLAPAREWLAGLPLGEARRGRVGRGGDVYGVREHRTGDDLRDVHWKLSAKREELVSREYEQPSSPQLTLCFDNRWPAGQGTDQQTGLARQDEGQEQDGEPSAAREQLRDELEHAVAVCAGLAAELVERGFVLGLLTRHVRVSPGSGPAQLDRLLHALALLRFAGDPAGERSPPSAAGDGQKPQAGAGGGPATERDAAAAGTQPLPMAAPGEACLLVGHAAALEHWAGGRLLGILPCQGSLSAALDALDAAEVRP